MAAQPSSGLFAFWTSCCLRQPPATRSGLNHRTSSAGGQAGQHRGGRGHRRRRRQQPRRQGDWRWRLRLRHCLPGAPALQLRVALSSACQPDGSEPCSRTYFEENSCIQSSWSSVAAAANGVSGEPEQTFGKACDAALLPLRTTWCGCRSASASPRRRWSTTRTWRRCMSATTSAPTSTAGSSPSAGPLETRSKCRVSLTFRTGAAHVQVSHLRRGQTEL